MEHAVTDVAEKLAEWNPRWQRADQMDLIETARREILSLRERLERLKRTETDQRAQLWEARLELLAAKAQCDPEFDHEQFLRGKGWV